jgi:CDP-diglyceride synthetase
VQSEAELVISAQCWHATKANRIKGSAIMKNNGLLVLAVFVMICLIIGYMIARDQMPVWAILAFIISSWLALSFGYFVGLLAGRA